MKRILVPTDFSTCAGYAEMAAVAIAQKTGSRVTFLHGISSNGSKAGDRAISLARWSLRSPSNGALDRLSAEEALSARVRSAIRIGVEAEGRLVPTESQGLEYAIFEEQDVDLIVMGSHGNQSVQRSTPGPLTAKVMRQSKIPVLVMNREFNGRFSMDTVVFASGLEHDTHHAFEKLLRFSREIGTHQLHFLEVNTPSNFKPSGTIDEEMHSYLSQHGSTPTIKRSIYNHYNVETGIIEYARQSGAQIIALSNHGRTDLSGLFIASIPENIIKFATQPVLSIGI
jgi:nucleotide-binding universal stress UspA family protein